MLLLRRSLLVLETLFSIIIILISTAVFLVHYRGQHFLVVRLPLLNDSFGLTIAFQRRIIIRYDLEARGFDSLCRRSIFIEA